MWYESPFFSPRERAALAWVEALTNIQQGHAPNELFDALKPHFSEQEIVEITFATANMNAWNRMGIGMRNVIPV
ncbi:MAG TPA: carboxymuconolactone decarboxylase family protein [Rhodocyclaceae bacterium]|nr:carboxymuconolactone decarboxylase family protein [Rhodocyclaceae bacterium]